MPKIVSLTHFQLCTLLCINGSKVTALNVFSKPQRLHCPIRSTVFGAQPYVFSLLHRHVTYLEMKEKIYFVESIHTHTVQERGKDHLIVIRPVFCTMTITATPLNTRH